MPGRKFPLIDHEVYHVFNRGIDHRSTFTTKREFERALISLKYYLNSKPPLKLSKFLRLEKSRRQEASVVLNKRPKLVSLLAYCFMPNHFHFLIRQIAENGIAKFLSNFQNSYTRYFNIRHDRDGSLFLDQFKAVHIATDEQLLHVSRYIHLNPYTSGIIKTLSDLEYYPWSSLSVFLGGEPGVVDVTPIMAHFAIPSKYKRVCIRPS